MVVVASACAHLELKTFDMTRSPDGGPVCTGDPSTTDHRSPHWRCLGCGTLFCAYDVPV